MSRKTYILLFVVSVALGLNAISNIYQHKIALAHSGSYVSSDAGDTYLPLVFAQGPGDGDIFAGVMARCASSGSYIDRSFNKFNEEPITITDGDALGYCQLDFGFDISDRYIIVTVAHPDTPLGVSVSAPPLSGTEVTLFVWHAGNGAAVEGGKIFAVVY